MHLLFFLGLFVIIQFIMGVHNPWPKLFLIGIIPGTIFFKNKFRIEIDRFSVHKIVVVLLVLLSLFRGGQFIRKMIKAEVKTEDIAVVYHHSIKSLLAGENPYLKKLDPYPFHYKGRDTYFDRPKYTPLQIFTYMPFVYFLGLKGIYLGNLVVYLLLAFFLYQYFKPTNRHAIALLMLLGGEFVFNKLFSKGVNDLLPAFLVLLSWFYMTSPKRSGTFLGLSFLAKQLPAGIFGLWYLLLKRWQNFFLCIPIVLLVIIPFFVSDLKAAYENLLLFNLLRPVRETSLLLYLPEAFHRSISFLGLLTTISLPLWYKSRWGLPFIGLTIFILTSKMSPGNYFIWCFPFLIMWLLDEEKTIESV